MAGFLYYLPGSRGSLSLADMSRAGIGYAFDQAPSCADVDGPDGGRGVVCAACDRPDPPPLGYSNTGQVWRKVPAENVSPRAWVGMVASLHPPTPIDLIRLETLPGHDVRMANDTVWSVPFARRYIETDSGVASYDCLPQTVDLDDDGRFIEGDRIAKHNRLWGISEAFVAYTTEALATKEGETEPQLDPQKLFNDASDAIAVNYYISAVELVLLRALDTNAAINVLRAVIDWDNFLDLANKKKHSEPLSTDDGKPALPQDTSQPLLT